MKYRIAVEDKELFAKYLYKEFEYLSLASFGEEDKKEICSLLCKEFYGKNPQYPIGDGIIKWFYSSAVDDNGVLYIVDFGNKKFTEYGRTSCAAFAKAVEMQNAERKRMSEKSRGIKNNFSENSVVYKKSFIPGYKKCSFFDADAGIEIPFRFRVCKGKEKRPLLVYLHGAGSLGNDNLKQFLEFAAVGIKPEEECFVLLPQCDNFTGNNLSTINLYARSVRSLVGVLAASYPVDESRIYVVGCSFGGACAWYSVYDNKGFYAAAIPLMGYFPDADSEVFDVEAFRGAKIWAGHAKDDKVVPYYSDERVCKRISGVCDIRLSLYEKGGHVMMKKFFRSEKWQQWLFSRTNRD